MVGAPKDFTITVKEIRVSAGAKFLVCLTGAVMTMPGLPKEPLAKKIDIDSDYTIHNLSFILCYSTLIFSSDIQTN